MVESAGTLLYRHRGGLVEVLLVHPSGAYNRRAPWSIPKGVVEAGESLEAAARRETLEETGVCAGDLVSLGAVMYRQRGKRIHGFAGPAPLAAEPACASWEVDRAEFVTLDRAREVIHPAQTPFMDRLLERLADRGPASSAESAESD
jgi:predicted NUDIX family NTP pyrophosphohydrolase